MTERGLVEPPAADREAPALTTVASSRSTFVSALAVAAALVAIVAAAVFGRGSPPPSGPIAAVAAASPTPALSVATSGPSPTAGPRLGWAIGPNRVVIGSQDLGAGRYPDDLPRSIGGRPVLRGDVALAHARQTSDTTPFLLGGWLTVTDSPISCPAILAPLTWTSDCGGPSLSDTAGIADLSLAKAVTFLFLEQRLRSGPIVVQVHVHDPRARGCGTAASICDATMVADTVVWSGDSATYPNPLAEPAAVAALRAFDPSIALESPESGQSMRDCGGTVPGARAYAIWGGSKAMPELTALVIAPNAEVLRRGIRFEPAGNVGLQPGPTCWVAGGRSRWLSFRWLVVDNVAVMVGTQATPTAVESDYVDRLEQALRSADGNR